MKEVVRKLSASLHDPSNFLIQQRKEIFEKFQKVIQESGEIASDVTNFGQPSSNFTESLLWIKHKHKIASFEQNLYTLTTFMYVPSAAQVGRHSEFHQND